MEQKEISQAVISRLPRYFRYLGELKDEGVERISSQELSELMQVTASQIRQDFNNFGGFGQQGYGYNVEYLYDEISKILGLNKTHHLIIIGAGNLGQAIGNYMNFERRGFILKGLFDCNPALEGKKVRGISVQPMDHIGEFVKENDIDIAVLTIPKTSAVAIAEELVSYGIKAIWNFAHVDLHVPEGIQVENVHLSDSLMKLSYNINRYNSENTESRQGGRTMKNVPNTEDKYRQALKGKELPLLPLDNKWHQLFTQTETNAKIRRLEEQLNSLIKRQGKLNTEKKEIRKLKRKLMDQIVVTVDELDQGVNQKINDKKIDTDKRLVKECNTKLSSYEKELKELPKQIEEINVQLMLATMDICYKKIQENTAQIEELTEWIDSMRIELKKNVVRKQDRETQNRQLYSYMHDIFGADVLEVFDMKYNPLEKSAAKKE